MTIFLKDDDALSHMFNACTTDQVKEFMPEKRSLRIYGHSTTIRLERAFWTVLEAMADDHELSLVDLISRIQNECIVANDKNLTSCLRVMCLKYLNIYSG